MVYMGEGSWGGRVHPPHLNCHSSFYDVQHGGGRHVLVLHMCLDCSND